MSDVSRYMVDVALLVSLRFALHAQINHPPDDDADLGRMFVLGQLHILIKFPEQNLVAVRLGEKSLDPFDGNVGFREVLDGEGNVGGIS